MRLFLEDAAGPSDDSVMLWLAVVLAAATGTPEPQSVLGKELQVCSKDPLTGWFRDGYCRTDERDRGLHVVCASVTEVFLQYSREQGNDLVTPSPDHRFPGLKPGDRWCVCAARWLQAHRAGKAPPIVPEASDDKALTVIPKTLITPL